MDFKNSLATIPTARSSHFQLLNKEKHSCQTIGPLLFLACGSQNSGKGKTNDLKIYSNFYV